MKSLNLLLLFCSLLLISCANNTKIDSIEIVGDSADINNQIQLCLNDKIGYGNYDLNFDIMLNDGVKIKENAVIYGHVDNEKRCFDLFLGASFTDKGDSIEYHHLISNIYKTNVKSMIIKIYKSGDLISSSTFQDL